jgi:hypothetical protein
VELGGRPLITDGESEAIVFAGLRNKNELFYLSVLIEVGKSVFLYGNVVGKLGEDISQQRGLVNQPR